MRIPLRRAAPLALAFALGSCSDNRGLNPVGPTPTSGPSLDISAASLPAVRISEIHYDNAGADAGEAVEISGPRSTNLSGWRLVLYNGNPSQRNVYGTIALSGVIPETTGCGARGVLVFATPGLQNGGTNAPEPDGLALVDPSNTVVEFLSYEGSFTAAGTVSTANPAAGMTSTDIGVSEVGSESANPVTSLKRNDADGVWNSPTTNNFGTCNVPPAEVASVLIEPASATIVVGTTQQFTATAFDAVSQPIAGVAFTWSSNGAVASINATGLAKGEATGDAIITATAPNGESGSASLHIEEAPPPPLPGTIRFSEIHYDNGSTDQGEAIEIEGPGGTSLNGWSIALYNGDPSSSSTPLKVYNTRVLSGTIIASCSGRGVLSFTYLVNGIQNGDPDGFALVDASGSVVEFLSYGGTFIAADGPAAGIPSTNVGVKESSNTPVGHSLQRGLTTGVWFGPTTNTFGACNGDGGFDKRISFTGRVPSDPPLPVGFEDQLFAELIIDGAEVATTFAWSSETPDIVSIDQNGVMRALAAGTAILRATAAVDGTMATYSLQTRVATAGETPQYAENTEFGTPRDADASDDYLVIYPQYTASFNRRRGTPNWVSYNIDATHFGPEDRCDCFTFDPSLPSSFDRYTTADYTGAGAFHGYGIDRGHLARSFDRTGGSLDNARTFYFTNIIPQAADNNQGPWSDLEFHIGDFARLHNREVYVIAGVAGDKGTVKGEGKITIPTHVWKVAVIMPRNQGLSNVDDASDIEVVAVIMPNTPGIRDVEWTTYKATVDAVEALSGYNLLDLLPDQIEIAVESNTRPPTAGTNGPFTSAEGSVVTMSATSSSDPDAGDALTYQWVFGDGTTGIGETASHTYTQDGVYNVSLTVTDSRGLAATTMTKTTVANVTPVVAAFAEATLLPGEAYTANGSFADPGADTWTGTVDFGDGSGPSALTLSNKSFLLSHRYNAAGAFTVGVGISDDDAIGMRTQTITVLTPVQGIESAMEIVKRLAAGSSAIAATARVARTSRLDASDAKWLATKLDLAIKHLEGTRTTPAVNQLEDVVARVDALVQNGDLSSSDAEPLRSLVMRVIRSVTS